MNYGRIADQENYYNLGFNTFALCDKFYLCIYYLIIEMNIAANISTTLMSISWMADEFPTKTELILNLFSEKSESDDLMSFGIHSTK